ncbi:hypothetical protein EON65_18880 [archaeon]|nr:MAG: hypothetical protein EON65_18880 [archaeon]
MVELNPSYAPLVSTKSGCIVQLRKALYGCIESALLWYQHLSCTLESLGFTSNPMDGCVFNPSVRINVPPWCIWMIYLSPASTQKSRKGLSEVSSSPTWGCCSISCSGELTAPIREYVEGILRMARSLGRASTPETASLPHG